LPATEYDALPEPTPDPLVIVTKPDAEDSHAQPSGMPTLTMPLPPPAGKSWLVGDNVA
jgi:hypothetical protein